MSLAMVEDFRPRIVPAPELITPGDAARIAGVSPSTVSRWVDEGRLAEHRTAGGHRRVNRVELVRLLDEITGN